jgi:hypothetical protein
MAADVTTWNQPNDSGDGGAIARHVLEWVLRAVALLALAWLLLLVIQARHTRYGATAEGADMEEALARWSTSATPSDVHVQFSAPPSPVVRDWLAALTAAGTEVSWGGQAPVASAVAVEPVADPMRPTQLLVAGPVGAQVTFADRLGGLDSVVLAGVGARATIPRLEGELRAEIGAPMEHPADELASAPREPLAAKSATTTATAALRDSLTLRPVLLLSEAGWEAKFVMAALEERGWKVHAQLALGPGGDLLQGPAALRLDTANYAAVIALDSLALRFTSGIRRYVQDGGGLVAAGEGAALRALAPVLPATASGTPTDPGPFATDSGGSPREALALVGLGNLSPDAIALEHLGSAVAVAAWRMGEGRVAQVGFHDTWRWRMASSDVHAVDEHREWWSILVSSVAYAPRTELGGGYHAEPTPLASLIAAIGPATPETHQPSPGWGDPRFIPWFAAIAFAALLLEWLSRRLRGQR